jgi:hypothetical protein
MVAPGAGELHGRWRWRGRTRSILIPGMKVCNWRPSALVQRTTVRNREFGTGGSKGARDVGALYMTRAGWIVARRKCLFLLRLGAGLEFCSATH